MTKEPLTDFPTIVHNGIRYMVVNGCLLLLDANDLNLSDEIKERIRKPIGKEITFTKTKE